MMGVGRQTQRKRYCLLYWIALEIGTVALLVEMPFDHPLIDMPRVWLWLHGCHLSCMA
jgi:hypothetical protein